MRFTLWQPQLLNATDAITVDFNVKGLAGLNLDHHFGQTTPVALRKDLATDVVLTFVEHNRADLSRFACVTNDHFDTDGILSAYCILNPKSALEHRDKLVAAAQVGDFYEYVDDASALISIALQDDLGERSIPVPRAQRNAWLYEQGLELLPDLLVRPDQYADRWAPRLQSLHEELEYLRRGASIEHRPADRLTIIRTERPVGDLAVASSTTQPIVVVTRPRTGGRSSYDVWLRMRYSWGYELPSAPSFPTIDFSPMALRLQLHERRLGGPARWRGEEYESIGWRVTAEDSLIPEDAVVTETARCVRRPRSPDARRREPTFLHRAQRVLSREWARRRPVIRSAR